MFNFLAASTLFGLYSRRGKVKASTCVASNLSATKTSTFLSSSWLAKSNLSRSGPQLHQGSHGVSLLQAGQALGRIEEKSTRLCWHKSIFDAFCGRAKATICLTSIHFHSGLPFVWSDRPFGRLRKWLEVLFRNDYLFPHRYRTSRRKLNSFLYGLHHGQARPHN